MYGKRDRDSGAPSAQLCEECDRYMRELLLAVRSTRKVLQSLDRAAQSGVIDDVGFLATEASLGQALSTQRKAREAYFRHRQEQHG